MLKTVSPFNTAAPTFSGDVTLSTGNLVIGTSGKGIDFSATPGTGTSELLADYEEGTWTPVIQGSGTAGTYELDGGTTYASYTKIGRQVTLQCQIAFAAVITAGGSGNLNIIGIPFAKGNAQTPVGAISLFGVDLDNTCVHATIRFSSGASSSTLIIYQIVDNAAGLSLPISAVSASDFINFTVTYFV
jgi:hypothetical protein